MNTTALRVSRILSKSFLPVLPRIGDGFRVSEANGAAIVDHIVVRRSRRTAEVVGTALMSYKVALEAAGFSVTLNLTQTLTVREA